MTENREIDISELQDNQVEFLEAYEASALNIKRSCKAINVSRQTYYDWIGKSDIFKKAVEDIKEGFKDDVETAMAQELANGNTTMMIFFAKTKMKDRGYIEKIEVDNNKFDTEYLEQLKNAAKTVTK